MRTTQMFNSCLRYLLLDHVFHWVCMLVGIRQLILNKKPGHSASVSHWLGWQHSGGETWGSNVNLQVKLIAGQ